MKAILVISFGTTFSETREKTIEAIENDLAKAFPDRRLYRAWTSRFIIRKLKERDGLYIDTPSEALERMKRDGVTDVIVQPTHIIPGAEFNKLTEEIKRHSEDFENLSVGVPLLTEEKDLKDTATAISNIFHDIREDEALILMGHGTPNGNNSVYTELEETFRNTGNNNVFIGTVEAVPALDDVLSAASAEGFKKAVITPLLIVAGDHALNDMAGDDEDSWTSTFRRAGFNVRCVVKGLGEYKEIRDIIISHAKKEELN